MGIERRKVNISGLTACYLQRTWCFFEQCYLKVARCVGKHLFLGQNGTTNAFTIQMLSCFIKQKSRKDVFAMQMLAFSGQYGTKNAFIIQMPEKWACFWKHIKNSAFCQKNKWNHVTTQSKELLVHWRRDFALMNAFWFWPANEKLVEVNLFDSDEVHFSTILSWNWNLS